MHTYYRIKVEPNFYVGDIHGQDGEHYLGAGYYHDEPVYMASLAEAERICAMLNDPGDGPYVCAYNQYAAPDYRVVKVRLKTQKPVWSLAEAMAAYELQYDFLPTGEQVVLTEAELFG